MVRVKEQKEQKKYENNKIWNYIQFVFIQHS